ncbi:MAG: carboxypeptidase regulatory-like domain-containing protein [Acidimicrobiales bacterium]|nr:carboxypeptidase regulatory-like domain-containing protein [Acidimicrobiales bacterium]
MTDEARHTTTRHRGRRLLVAAVLLTGALVMTAGSSASPAAADGNEAPGAPTAYRALSAGTTHACAIVSGGSLRCWGANGNGQLGQGTTSALGNEPREMGAFLPPVDLGTGRNAKDISVSSIHSCAVLDNGQVKCWGAGGNGLLGQGTTDTLGDQANEMGDDLPPIDLGTGRTATAVTAAGSYSCALLDNGQVKCWGFNNHGQLGQGTTDTLGDQANEMGDDLAPVDLGTGRSAKAITAGGFHVCAILDDSTVKCWGLNNHGQLGQGTNDTLGNDPDEMGDDLPIVDLGAGRTAAAISAGFAHTCALLDNAQVKCWGSGAGGALGQGSITDLGDQAGEMGDDLPAVDLGTGRTGTGVSAGGNYTCARLDNGRVKCWGADAEGRLGQGATGARGDAPGEMGDNLAPVDLGTGRTATAVTTSAENGGLAFTCATLDNGARKCWGNNGSGQLGQEDTFTRGDETGEMGDNLATVFLPPAGLLSGTVRDADTNAVLPGAMVVALRTSDFGLGASAIADANGEFSMSAPTGSYFYYLLDPAAAHDDGFFGPPLTITVLNGSSSNVPLTMEPLRGSFSGTVVDQGTGEGIGSVQVYAIGGPGLVASATTAANGTYTVTGLPAGTYHAVFVDGLGRRLAEYWPDSPDFGGSDPFNVTAGDTTPGIDAALLRP